MARPRALYVGQGWLGSCARGLREALVRQGWELDELTEEQVLPKWGSRPLRAALRLLRPALRAELGRRVAAAAERAGAQLVIVYKGTWLDRTTLAALRRQGRRCVNVYPDCSPLSHGSELAQALGEYDLVVSTKPWHPEAWNPLFGYRNRCVHVPHGYDPALHLCESPAREPQVDVAMVATYRPEYADLVLGLSDRAELAGRSVELYGAGWAALASRLPPGWAIRGAVHGHAYRRALQRAAVYVAPVTRDVVIAGRRYPGDEDTTRTYELPAAGAFFVHRRTDYVRRIFDEGAEVPMFDDAAELAGHVGRALADQQWREACRRAAHRRAVPRDSLDRRAAQVTELLAEEGIIDG